MMNRDRRLPDWLRFRSRPAAVVTALVTCLLLAPWVAEAQSNSAPTFTEGASATRSFHETIGDVAVETGSNIGAAVAATDTDASDTLTYTLQGTDAARFGINSTSGQLRTRVGEKYDHEAKSSYSVTVRVEDSSGGSDTITVTVNVTDQDEPPAAAPQLSGFGTVSAGTTVQLYLSFYPSFNPGRPAITSYEMRYRRGTTGGWTHSNWNFWCIEDIALLGDPRFQTVSDAIEDENWGNHWHYRAQVRAINDEGEGPWSASGSLFDGSSLPVYTTPNTWTTGAPTISGTAQVGETLTADISGIEDADGLNGLANPNFTYLWVRIEYICRDHDDEEICRDHYTNLWHARGSSYTLQPQDEGKTIMVKVTVIDDRCHRQIHSLRSQPTGTVISAVQPQRANTPATGAPTISGTAQVGHTLRAEISGIDDADGLVNASFTYQWERQVLATGAVTDIPGATGATYEVTSDDRDRAVRVSVSFSDAAENSETLSSYWIPVLTPPNNLATGAPTIGGTAQVGGVLTADISSIADADGLTNVSYGYQWIAGNGSSDVEIANATASTYSVAAEDVGRTIRVRVTFTDDADHEESLTSAATALVQPPAPDGPPGVPDLPEARAVFVGGVDLEWNEVSGADSYAVQLGRGGRWIDLPGGGVEVAFYGAGAIISGLDPEASLWFRVRAANGHGVSDWSEVRYTGSTSQFKLGRKARRENAPASGAPVVHGTARVGESLWGDVSGIEDGNGLNRVEFQYQWTSNDGSADADIAGATESGYTLVADDEGKTIKVKVAFTDRGGYSETRTSAATEAVAAAPQPDSPATGEPSIGGTAEVGETLTADITGITDDDGLVNATYGYQWVANDGTTDTDISGATDNTYTLVADDEGSTIKVRVIVTDDAGNETTLTSAATEAVGFAVQQQGASNTPATGQPTIRGTAQVGEVLTADTTGIADDDGLTKATYSYQWVANDGTTDADISGETDASYTLVADDVGKTIKVRVIVTDDAGNETTLTSAATEAVAARPNTSATGLPTIGGTAEVGETLTADTTGIADADGLSNVSYNYQWVANDGGAGADISGATDASYTLVAGDEGKTIQVKVSFKDDAGNEERLTSAATEAVASGGPTEPPGRPLKLKGVANADGTVTLSWEAPEDESVTGYQILRKRTSRGEQTLLVHVNDTGSTGTEYTDSEVTPDVLHAYRVKAINAAGVSKRSNVVRVTPVEPEQPSGNTSATGRPSIVGTVRVGETLTADTSGIADADGLDNVSYSYQWVVTDGGGYLDISGATGGTYTLVAIDRGLYIQVRVSFTDDAGNGETLTSAATEAVAAAP